VRRQPLYEPTPEEIAAACLRVQATWDAETRERRSPPEYRVKIQEVPSVRHVIDKWVPDFPERET
jgi:hypothetical protein